METMSRRPFARHTVQFDKKDDEGDCNKATTTTTAAATAATTKTKTTTKRRISVTTAAAADVTTELTPAAVEPLHTDGTVSVHSVVVSLPKVDDRNLLAIGCVLVNTAASPAN